MKKLLMSLVMLVGVSAYGDYPWNVWYNQNPNVIGTLSVSSGFNIVGKMVGSVALSAASADEDSGLLFTSTGMATGNAGKYSSIRGVYNWYGGDNATFIGEGVEGVVRSRAVDTNMTGRGVSGRIYAGTGYTLHTGIGVEGAWRIEDGNKPTYGSSYAGVRAWCYPGWDATSSTNVVNNYGVWIVNEHVSNEVAAGMRFDISYGGKFTKDIQLQNGETIDNYTDGQTLITSPITAVSGMMNVSGTQTNGSSVTVKGNGGLQVVDQVNTRTALVSTTMTINATTISNTNMTFGGYAALSLDANSDTGLNGNYTDDTMAIQAGGIRFIELRESTNDNLYIGGDGAGVRITSVTVRTPIEFEKDTSALNNSYVAQHLTANTATVSSMTATTGVAVGQAIGGIFNLKGISSDEVLLVTTPALFDCYISSTDYRIWIATGATPAGFKRSAAFGATP